MADKDIFEQLHPDFVNDFRKNLQDGGISLNNLIGNGEETDRLTLLAREFISRDFSNFSKINRRPQKEELDGFYKNFNKIWLESFERSELYINMIMDACYTLQIPFDMENIKSYVLARLMGKAIRTYVEILTLLQSGYPYGAVALARVLFELNVIMQFIDQNDAAVAEKFYLASEKDAVLNDNYEWARVAGCFKKGDWISLKKLLKECNLTDEGYEDLYTFHCNFAHPSPQSVTNELGTTSNDIFIGPTRFGIGVPGNNATLFIQNMLVIIINHFDLEILRLKGVLCIGFAYFVQESYRKAAEKL